MIITNAAGWLMGLLFLMQSIQTPAPTFSIQSWKKGDTQIRETQFEVNVSKAKPSVKFSIADISGYAKYRLSIKPGRPQGYISSWIVILSPADWLLCFFSSDQCTNLLQPSNDPYQDAFSDEDAVSWFYPKCGRKNDDNRIEYFCPKLMQKRVIQVERFYVILHVLRYETAINNPDELQSMTLRIQFSNSNPESDSNFLEAPHSGGA